MNSSKNTAPASSSILVWMDLEMTGLDPEVDEILEAAVLLTDLELKPIAEGPQLIIQQKPQAFARMDEWNQNQHTKSGLWPQVLASSLDTASAEKILLDFLSAHVPRRTGILAGNSIWQDRRFLTRHMPQLEAYLHYRMVDVSSIKSLVQAWYPNLSFSKEKNCHRALDDIRESLSELQFYRSHCFR